MFSGVELAKEGSSMVRFQALQTAFELRRDSAGTNMSISQRTSLGTSDMLGGAAGIADHRRRRLGFHEILFKLFHKINLVLYTYRDFFFVFKSYPTTSPQPQQ